MTVQWERLVGDTSRFAIRLAFAPDPDDGRAAAPDMSHSWGSFQLWVDGRNLCTHSEEGERIESVHWYLLPLMEWLARNWNPLLHEERLPVKNAGGNAWASLRRTRFPPAAVEGMPKTLVTGDEALPHINGNVRGAKYVLHGTYKTAPKKGSIIDAIYGVLKDGPQTGETVAQATKNHPRGTRAVKKVFGPIDAAGTLRWLVKEGRLHVVVDLEAAWEEQWHGWWSRHALRAASDGGLFPDVVFRRLRDAVEISWGDVRSAGMPAGFDFLECSQRAVHLPPAEVAAPLHDVLVSACSHLVRRAAESDRVRELQRTLGALRRASQHQKRLGWLAGLGTDENTIAQGFARTKKWLSNVHGAKSLLQGRFDSLVVEGSCQASLMFGCVAPDIRREDIIRLAEIMVQGRQQHLSEGNPELRQFQQAVPVDESDALPWAQGYQLAEDFIERFFEPSPSSTRASVDIRRILADLGVEVVEVRLTDETIRAVAIAGPLHRPCVAWNSACERNADERGHRFALAHELCHLLFDADAGRSFALASGPWAPVDVEQRADAFAAMLLMPTEAVHSAIAELTEPLGSRCAVSRIADQFNTGFHATLWHLANLGFIDEYTRQRIFAPSG